MLGGKLLTELNENGAKHRTFVYAGSTVLATQEVVPFYGTQGVTWEHRDPSNASFRSTMTTGDIAEYRELDPTGADTTSPLILTEPNDEVASSLVPYPSFSDPRHPGTTYAVNNIRVPVDDFMQRLDFLTHGSSLALAEMSTKVRVRNYEVLFPNGRRPDFGGDLERAFWVAYKEHGTLVRNFVLSDAWSLIDFLAPGQQNTGISKPLNPNDRSRYDKEKEKAVKRGISESCAQFLTSHGIDPGEVIKAIALQRPFSGPQSTISRIDAGILDFESDGWQTAQRIRPNHARDIANGAVKLDFSNGTKAETGIAPGGMTGADIAARSNVYFSGGALTAAIIFHEALHSATGRGDDRLAAMLRLKITTSATDAITKALKAHGCT